jgi:hypothetical protein
MSRVNTWSKVAYYAGYSVGFGTTTGLIAVTGYCFDVSWRPEKEKLHVVIDLDSTILHTLPIKSFF